jgi:hypothetical protein
MRSLLYTFSFITSLLFLLKGVTASNVIELTPSNFDDVVGSGKPALVRTLHSEYWLTTRRLNSLLPGNNLFFLLDCRYTDFLGVVIGETNAFCLV